MVFTWTRLPTYWFRTRVKRFFWLGKYNAFPARVYIIIARTLLYYNISIQLIYWSDGQQLKDIIILII
jgi:hypothetical protein